MLFNQEGLRIVQFPHEQNWKLIEKRLSQSEIDAIYDELDKHFSTQEVNTSSWIPGSDWVDTVYMPIWEKAAKQNYDIAAMLFGLIVWMYVKDRPDAWMFGKYSVGDTPIKGTTYFRVPALD